MMLRQLLTIVTLLFIAGNGVTAKDYTVCSPNGKNKVTVSNGIILSITHNDKSVVKVKTGLSQRKEGCRMIAPQRAAGPGKKDRT